MKKTNRKNSPMRKLLPAFAMLTVSAISLSSATYAWFTMNKTVSVTGMQVHTAVGSNLLISETNASAASYGNTLSQTRQCLLEPASSIDGIGYYWTSTSNVDARGDAIAENYTAYAESTAWDSAHTAAGKTGYDSAFNLNYGKTSPAANYTDVAYGYVDYTFYLKAVNTEQTTQYVDLTKLELKYGGSTVTDKAWRAALIVQDITNQTEYTAYNTAPTATNVVSLFTLQNAANFDNAPKAIGSSGLVALSYGSSKTAYNQAGTFVQEIASGGTAYYKVTVRLWLEGEDTSCTNATYALLTGDYTLDLEFSIDPTATAVDKISTPATS